MLEYMRTVLNGLKAWVIGEVNKLLSKIDNDIAALRKTLDEASSDFVVHGTVNSDHTVTLDKTFAQISEAIGDGKIPTLEILDDCFQLTSNTERYIMFGAMFGDKGGSGLMSVYVYPNADPSMYQYQLLNLNSNGTIPQSSMASDPTGAMQIATKKYVDEHSAADAVLYTAQTLTAEQKQQARDNIDAAIADFVINGTVNSNMEVTLDKTFAQIQSAVQDGKQPVVKLSTPGPTALLPLTSLNDEIAFFIAWAQHEDTTATFYCATIASTGYTSFTMSHTVTINNAGAMDQVNMAFNPISPMQIATKKYVDDKECILKSTTPGSTKKFKITVDDSGNISATEVT